MPFWSSSSDSWHILASETDHLIKCKQTDNNEPCGQGETPAPIFPKIDYLRFRDWAVNSTESPFSLARYNSSQRFKLSVGGPELPAYIPLF